MSAAPARRTGAGPARGASPLRKIIHVDMDAFYASVEQRDDPALRGKPVAVGGGGPRGVVMAASYEARVFGVRSAMPGFQARRLCPELIFVPHPLRCLQGGEPPDPRDLPQLHRPGRAALARRGLSRRHARPSAGRRRRPRSRARSSARSSQQTGLTASAGVSFNKFLAKVASAMDKPDGLTVIRPEDADAFIAKLPIERFFGVGPVTARKMKEAGIHDGADLRARSEAELVNRFGKVGRHYFRIARGQDERAVSPDRPYKSIGAEETFERDLSATPT